MPDRSTISRVDVAVGRNNPGNGAGVGTACADTNDGAQATATIITKRAAIFDADNESVCDVSWSQQLVVDLARNL